MVTETKKSTRGLYRVILEIMKTAISVPNETHARVERLAKKHGMNRSQFYATAASRFADELEAMDITAAIDAVVDDVNEDDSMRFAVAAGRVPLSEDFGEW